MNPKEKEALLKVLRPKCFGIEFIGCSSYPCDHEDECEKRFFDRQWLTQAIEKKAEHERKAQYFAKKIKKLMDEGISPE